MPQDAHSDRIREIVELAVWLHEQPMSYDHRDPPNSQPNRRGESCKTCNERAAAILQFQERRQRAAAMQEQVT